MIIKAVAGGGGRGMNVVRKEEDLARLYQTTRATAQAVFKDSAVYIERYLDAPRHTEVQLVCDPHGNGVYFFERDCSVQRRHQKLIEEAPSIHLSDEQRRDIGERAVSGALSVGYTGAGTMEFLLDDDGNLSFMEMNARIQVEHPVSEMITSVDLIQEQIRVAAGEPLSVSQDDVVLAATRSSAASTPRIPTATSPRRRAARRLRAARRPVDPRRLALLPGLDDRPVLRLADREADRLGADPPEAIERMDRALSEFQIEGRGVKTTIPFHRRVLADERFRSGDVSTDFVEQFLAGEAAAAEERSRERPRPSRLSRAAPAARLWRGRRPARA